MDKRWGFNDYPYPGRGKTHLRGTQKHEVADHEYSFFLSLARCKKGVCWGLCSWRCAEVLWQCIVFYPKRPFKLNWAVKYFGQLQPFMFFFQLTLNSGSLPYVALGKNFQRFVTLRKESFCERCFTVHTSFSYECPPAYSLKPSLVPGWQIRCRMGSLGIPV